MDIVKSDFLISAASKAQYPPGDRPEVAFIGRSNVGKSSIINSLTNRRALARVSNTPGRTRLVNFFLINDTMHLVDLPGYGYAKVSKTERANLERIITEYFENRRSLDKVILLVDSRHRPSADDVGMYSYIRQRGIPCLVVATKLDKLKRNEIRKNEKIIRETLGMDPKDRIIMYSSLTRENRDTVLEEIFRGLTEKTTSEEEEGATE